MNNNDDFFQLSPNEWLALNYALTVFLANGLNSNQLNIIGNFLCAVGQNMLLLQAWIGSCPNSNAVYYTDNHLIQCTQSTSESPDSEIETMKKKLAELENQLANLINILLTKEAQDKPNNYPNCNSN